MLNLSGISNHHHHHQKRNSEASSSTAALPPVYGGSGNNNNNYNNNNQQQNATSTTQLPPSSSSGNPHPHHHHYQGTTASDVSSVSGNSAETVFDDEVPVKLRYMDREEVVQQLGVCVQVIKNGPFRKVHVRITDPKDPFFLFTMELAEDDYGRFKDHNELNVDFGGFPRDLVAMLVAAKNNNAGDNSHHNNNNISAVDMSTISTSAGGANARTVLTFVISQSDNATLRILEKTSFRSVEHLSLVMIRQGDVGQKQYLAERFRFFLRSFHASENQRANDMDSMSKQISDLSMTLDQIRSERDDLRQQNAVQASEHKAELASTVDKLRATAEEQSRSSQSDHEQQVAALTKQHQQEQKRNQNEIDSLQFRLQQSAKEIHDLEAERLRLSTELAQKTENLTSATNEIKRLKDKVDELTSFKKTATREKNELDMAAVASQERLKHMTDLLKLRDEEVSQLRRQADTNDGALRRSNEQLDSTRKKLDDTSTEQSLSKAHHIIATHLQALKSAKEKQHALLQQVQAAEKTANDKTMEYERVKLETAADREKTATLQSRVTELKEQLKRAEEQNSSLANDLKQSQEALLHLGRSSASTGAGGLGGRSYSTTLGSHRASTHAAFNSSTTNNNNNENANPHSTSTTSTAAPFSSGLSSSTYAPAPITLMKEFARNNNNYSSADASGGSSFKSPASRDAGGITGSNNNTNNNNYHISRYGGSGATGTSNISSISHHHHHQYPPSGSSTTGTMNGTHQQFSSSTSNSRSVDPMSMLKNTASGALPTSGNAHQTSSYFPSTA